MATNKTTGKVPSYRRHRASGQAVVTLSGRDVYLGEYGTAASKRAYERAIGEWLAGGRVLAAADGGTISVGELLAAYERHAVAYYSPDGKPSATVYGVRKIVATLGKLYGGTAVGDFTPLRLVGWRDRLVATGLARSQVNRLTIMARRAFKWGTANGLVPAAVWQSLLAVDGLRAGRTDAPERAPITAVSDDLVNRTLPHLPQVVADMVRVQRLTGARPGEVCRLTTGSIDTTGAVWLARLTRHKTAHHGHQRIIAIGPQAQAILRPYLRTDLEAPLFSPRDSEAARLAQRQAARKTPQSCGNVPGSNRVRRPKRVPGTAYTASSYGHAVARGCKTGNLAHWHPNQLRHSRATELRKLGGIEMAQVALGHARADVTQLYAERNLSLAVDAARATG